MENHQTTKDKIMEFWFWFKPDPNTVNKLESKKVEYHIIPKELINQSDFQKKNEKLNLILNYSLKKN